MNTPQRIVLIVGAVALLIMLYFIGNFQQDSGGAILPAGRASGLANIWDWHSAIVRGVVISAATAAIYLAVGKRKQ
jgi:hypothetical protein